MYRNEHVPFRLLLVLSLVFGVMGIVFGIVGKTGWASPTTGEATIFSPNRVGGASGRKDERDADIYPSVAYDPSTGRYLAVWLTARNAGSSSDGFDVYGVFLDRTGQSEGSEFRISDNNTAARNGLPTVAAGKGEFAVAWAAKQGTCRVYVQQITDTSYRADHLLASSTGHHHSPSLAYNPKRRRYTLAYVSGDDYMPPTFFGADTDDCGNNPSSTSSIQATEFYFSDVGLVTGTVLDLSDVSSSAFRPHLAYSNALEQYLVVWEDRRNANEQAYHFDVYAQRFSDNMFVMGNNIALDTGGDYTNYDTSATWTPHPVVAGGGEHFMTTWFDREEEDSAVVWSVKGSLISSDGITETAFTVAQMSFAQSHDGQAPTGFLSAVYASTAQEYLVGITSHLESVWGYLSLVRTQRISHDGQLLDKGGDSQSAPGVGYSVDYENDDQIAVGLAVNPVSGAGTADYIAIYAKHRTDQTAQDFDIWSVRIQVPAPHVKSVYLPLVSKAR